MNYETRQGIVKLVALMLRIGFAAARFDSNLKNKLAKTVKEWSWFSGEKIKFEAAADVQAAYAKAMGYEICPACGWAIDGNDIHPFCTEKMQEMQKIKAGS